MSGDTLDLFAGMGGFDLAARALGVDPLGIEWDPSACATREAAGLRTLQADVSQLDPLDFAPIDGLCAGPPCPAFSMAGNGTGRRALGFYRDAMARMADGETISAAELDTACGDERAHLVLEPLRWALALRPRWIACEQVEPVLPLWEAMASALRQHGYWTVTAVLSSETFGVPQTRRRAILLASLAGPVSMPAATHQRYIPPRRREEATVSLFDVPEPGRIVAPEDRHLLPWVSMAQALGWGHEGIAMRELTERPREAARTMDEPAGTVLGSGGASRRQWVSLRMTTMPNSAVRALDDPAPTIAFGHDSASAVWLRASVSDKGFAKADPRRSDEPAQTVTGKHRSAEWIQTPTHYDRRQEQGQRRADGTRERVPLISVDRPAPTLAAQGLAKGRDVWVNQRPATTVNGDPRISELGHHDPSVSGSQQANAVRVSIEEALVLQGFPPDFPVQGSKTARYVQVGNCIPPLLAYHVLRAAGCRAL